MKKRFVAMVLIASAVTCSLFAHGKAESNEMADKPEYTPWGTYPIVTKPITLDVMVVQWPCVEDFNTNEFTKFMEEKTNVHINFIQVPSMAAKEKLSLTLASGEYPDAFLGFHDIVTNDMITTYGSQEHLLLPLNDYYHADKLPNLMAVADNLGKDFMPTMTSLDGNIYTLPSVRQAIHSSDAIKMYLYQPFLDALNLPVPTTTEEFYQALKAIKNDDPNGNGLQDEIPLAGAAKGWNTQLSRFIFNAFLPCNLSTDINGGNEGAMGYYLDNGTVKASVNDPRYREALQYINKLYKEGLIYNGSFTQDNKQLTQLVESSTEPTVGCVPAGSRAVFSSIGGERFPHFHTIAPLEGPEGFRNASNIPQNAVVGALMISSTSPYAEAILRYCDYFYSQEGLLNLRMGPEGIGWEKAKSGDIGLNGKQATWTALKPYNEQDTQNLTWVSVLLGAMTYDLRGGQTFEQIPYTDPSYYAPSYNEKNLHDETVRLYKPYSHPEYDVPTLKYTAEETEMMATVKTEFANYVRQSAVKFMVGSLDINDDATWNKYLKNLDKLQLPRIVESMQAAYDRQYK